MCCVQCFFFIYIHVCMYMYVSTMCVFAFVGFLSYAFYVYFVFIFLCSFLAFCFYIFHLLFFKRSHILFMFVFCLCVLFHYILCWSQLFVFVVHFFVCSLLYRLERVLTSTGNIATYKRILLLQQQQLTLLQQQQQQKLQLKQQQKEKQATIAAIPDLASDNICCEHHKTHPSIRRLSIVSHNIHLRSCQLFLLVLYGHLMFLLLLTLNYLVFFRSCNCCTGLLIHVCMNVCLYFIWGQRISVALTNRCLLSEILC